jgi:protein-tyrosine phosphatase
MTQLYCSRTVSFDWITRGLAVGGRLEQCEALQLAKVHNILRVIDLRAECCDDISWFTSQSVKLLRLPTYDHQPVSRENIECGVQWTHDAFRRNEKVLIHCEHGIGRSALLACCVLVSLGETPLNALIAAKQNRPRISPSPDQLHALLDWAQLHAEVGTTWDELARVAYARPP